MAKSAKGAGSIRQRPNGLWEARFSAGRDPATGKIIRKSVYGRTQKEVRKKLTEATAAVDSGTYTAPEKITFGQWLSIWLDEYCGGVKPRTRELYQNTVEYRIRPFLGGVRLVSLSPVMLQGYYNQSTAGQLEGVPAISGKTLHNVHGIIHKALQQAVSVGYLKTNPADACILPKYQRRELRPLDEQEPRAFFAAREGDPLRRLFLVALFTGMREGETMGLCWDGVDFAAGTISIRQQLQRHERKYIIVPPKNGKPRLILPAPFVMQLLREEKTAQAEAQLKAGALWENEQGFVFTNQIGQHMKRQTVYKHFKNVVEAIGLPSVRFHDLRHSYAVAAIRAGDDLKTVSENLGHASVSFTLDVYGHVTGDMRKSSADKMQNYIAALQA